ncbi:MAG TPA: hypothetical protein VMX54_00090 [Vicinamibacteria bacterium]|nr:hypothetical protein [Vicinamibacteria bacterium]
MDELERILSSPDDLAPSAGFTEAVLSATRRDETPPLRFPWARFAVGVAACLVLAVAVSALLAQAGASVIRAAGLGPLATAMPDLGYAALTVVASLALARLPRLFALRRSG